jgi:2-C-methyl-D-erythritol 4-phosphate cytidylyltransferase/2-C-methyl-D-erythritol 2,4-cyclodiphosphate synthase
MDTPEKAEKKFSFVIVAGGGSRRTGGLEKQFRPLGSGSRKPLWRWSVELGASLREEGIREIVLVLPKECGVYEEDFSWCPLPVKRVAGGATRSDSVRGGLRAAACDYVLVHDAARPFAGKALLRALMANTTRTAGAVPVVEMTDALKRIEKDAAGNVRAVRPVEREGLYATQTPQSFFRPALARVLDAEPSGETPDRSGFQRAAGPEGQDPEGRDPLAPGGRSFRDEAEAWLAAGLELRCVAGERMNFKITWQEDFDMAMLLAEARETEETRVGIGRDTHCLTPERALVLGGVVVDSPLGLLGHSDADIVAHTVADALLGAAGLPDIGNLFPASDDAYKDADSMGLLRQVVKRVSDERWEIVWVDAVIEAQVPRLGAVLPEVGRRVSAVLSPGGVLCFNIKAKSPEKTGDLGRARSMDCQAVATLRRKCLK